MLINVSGEFLEVVIFMNISAVINIFLAEIKRRMYDSVQDDLHSYIIIFSQYFREKSIIANFTIRLPTVGKEELAIKIV